jgi:hypothetical protein
VQRSGGSVKIRQVRDVPAGDTVPPKKSVAFDEEIQL